MLIDKEMVRFRAVRASGPGGQRTNRRSTKVQLWVKVGDLPVSEQEKKMIRKKLVNHINHDDEIETWSEEERSQEMNRKHAFEKLQNLVNEALDVPLPRIPTEPRRSAEERRIKEKKIISEKKVARRVSRKVK
ncbi:MAG: peptide chain release factor-like protein [Patescibacteria group bacterium]